MEPMSTGTMYNDQFELDPRAYGLTGGDAQADVELPPPGFYTVQLQEAGLRRNKSGEVMADKQGRPVFTIKRIAILDPSEFAGTLRLGPFGQDIYVNGRPQMNYSVRPAVPYTDRPPVFQVVKLLAAIDHNLVTGSLTDNCNEVERMLPTRPVVTVKLTYKGLDKAHVEHLLATGVEKNDAYKQSRLYAKAFRNADGTYRQVTTGPSGNDVQAQLEIDDFIPASRTGSLTLGPLKARQ